MSNEFRCGYFKDKIETPELISLANPEEAYLMLKELNMVDENTDKELLKDFAQKWFYETLLEKGFRRSLTIMYNNNCAGCKKCKSIRIPTKDFNFNKNQRRILRKNSDIEIHTSFDKKDLMTNDKVLLYRQYNKRHNPNKNMTYNEALEELKYWNGIIDDEIYYKGTFNIDYYLDNKLIGCSVIDSISNGISSCYFYYDISPEMMKRGLGTWSL